MNLFSFAINALLHKPLQSFLSMMAVMFGIALLTSVFLISHGISDGLQRNSAGIDVVAGAKGSPLQLILSSVYHTDVPIGNIDIDEYHHIKKNPLVRLAVPMAMGDNYKGWRVIGTTPDYIDLYNGQISEGRLFSKPFEVVAGYETDLKIGDTFAARHGFSAESTDIHEDETYQVVGRLNQTGTVLDKLFMTPLASVQKAHDHHHGHHHEHEEHHDDEEVENQITAILIKATNRAALINLPRIINQDEHMQAANPSYELTKLSKSFGVGRDMVKAVGISVLALSGLILFAILASSLTDRRRDMAVLRVLGATRLTLFLTLIIQGLIISGTGAAIGIVIGHVLAFSLTGLLGNLAGLVVAKDFLVFNLFDIYLFLIGWGAGALAALPVAISAARTDISKLLSQG